MSAIILTSMIALPVLWPAPADIMETSSIYSWTCSELLGWHSRIMRDGTPLLIYGHEPFPGWGSFESVTIRSPLEAGLWGNGKWEIDFESSAVPDSSYASKKPLDVSKTKILSLIMGGNDAEAQTVIDNLIADFSEHEGLAGAVHDIAEHYR